MSPSPGTRRVAAVDCGTNSLRLLVADVGTAPDGTAVLRDVERRMRIVRLGEGVDATGEFAPGALHRTLAAVDEVDVLCREHGVGAADVRFVATSATRDVANRAVLVEGVRERLGVEPEVVSGEEEAALSFSGATRELRGRFAEPFCVVDLGGGSTELVLGGARVDSARSVDVGSVRLTERHFRSDPPGPAEVAAARADVDAALGSVAADVPLQRTRTLVGVAGTVTTLTAAALDLPGYDSARIHGAVLPVDVARAACERILAMPREQRAALPYLHPGRVDVIAAGALVWGAVLDRLAAASGVVHVVTSEHDILDGIAFSVAER
ncbi:exopolyphosphatase/guanosine-5'-triphosphate,3'-diphosphate pyrophosphatase [Kineococcus xinjiangensis]|uniref:Exopolyphosphatase/guanosine-5'-triphosphate, 3'-diphosphate pyrophosphatase n=1 Tax=Kineococcus xinjiangensis TaxID=512762 RepID=A0A2S6IT52_9ACTN|nr:Ppx/GppA phosphatase family protein [Kineococcus xinjiangensis]PPK97226.1 exopolyphosphatase/guanosine-5'-triphosphate,3'-diphosphate pyrophosphatase [Kineococcus xinjiangensis]